MARKKFAKKLRTDYLFHLTNFQVSHFSDPEIHMSSKSLEEDPEKQQKVWHAEAARDSTRSQNWLTEKLLTLGVEARGLGRLFVIEMELIFCARDFSSTFGRQGWRSLQQDILRLVFYELQHSIVSPLAPNCDPDTPLISTPRFSAGTLGPVAFELGLRDTCLTILFFNLLCCAFPAYLYVSFYELSMSYLYPLEAQLGVPS